jgi:N,N-dimethylformamidase beta subunit-like protein/Big-like domain-containing protein
MLAAHRAGGGGVGGADIARRAIRTAVAAAALGALVLVPASVRSQPAPPAGLGAIALDGRVDLSWPAVPGAEGYEVLRGTGDAAPATPITPPGGTAATAFTDPGVADGTAYAYAVRALSGGEPSGPSPTVRATPRARACEAGNAVVLENCFPGDPGWTLGSPGRAADGGIEGFATATSIARGGSVDLKVASGGPYRIEVYRSGWYGGAGARLISVVEGLPPSDQPACARDFATGLVDCADWSTSTVLTTSAAWPSGVYLLRLVREDTGADGHVLLVVRDDAAQSDVLLGLPVTTYQAYNAWGGRSLYTYSSDGDPTVSGTARAVKVSFDRPYLQPISGEGNWYVTVDQPIVGWLERSGYDVTYAASDDLERDPAAVLRHQAFVSPAHDEYWSAGMRSAVTAARDAGVGLFFMGANEVYWKVRFEPGPLTGAPSRTLVAYKSTESGGPDPSGIPTGTWRDPAGANQPENALTGAMYVGDDNGRFFPLRVSAEEGRDPLWRHTGLDRQAPGTFADVGASLVGWEWDARVPNGAEPPGVRTLASSPATGELIQDDGNHTTPGSATAMMVAHTAASGALVVATGTNQWGRGLARSAAGVGEPNPIIQQATTNVLADMGALPETPAAGIVLDPPTPPAVRALAPADGASGVPPTTAVSARFSRTMDPATLAAGLSLSAADGAPVAAAVSYDAATRTATLVPVAPLAAGTAYTARLGGGVASAHGVPLAAPVAWTFTTAPAPPAHAAAAPGPPVVAAAATRLRLTGLAARPTRICARARRGCRASAVLTYRLSRAARVTLAIRREGRRPRALGTALLRGRAGVNRAVLGRFRGRRLAPGTYRLTLTATAPGGSRSVARARLVVRP